MHHYITVTIVELFFLMNAWFPHALVYGLWLGWLSRFFWLVLLPSVSLQPPSTCKARTCTWKKVPKCRQLRFQWVRWGKSGTLRDSFSRHIFSKAGLISRIEEIRGLCCPDLASLNDLTGNKTSSRPLFLTLLFWVLMKAQHRRVETVRSIASKCCHPNEIKFN